jgi:hypothetical protein
MFWMGINSISSDVVLAAKTHKPQMELDRVNSEVRMYPLVPMLFGKLGDCGYE